MSASRGEAVLPRADTHPTDKRAGRSIRPHHVECPFCPREGCASITIQLCNGCGRWFEVLVEDDDDASHLKAKTAGDSGGES